MKENYEQIPLLNIEQYTNYNSPVYTYDPYWDELQQEQLSSETIENSQIKEIAPAPQQLEVVEQFFTDDNQVGKFYGDRLFHGLLPAPQCKHVGAQVFLATETLISKNSVGAQVKEDTEKFAPQHEKLAHWVEKYWVERAGNKYWYYRYRWMLGRKSHRIYLGSVRSRQAQKKVELVRAAISNEKSPREIKELLLDPRWYS